MANPTLEERVTNIEIELKRLKQERTVANADDKPWWEKIRGRFKDDPAYVEAMQLGRAYRESLRPDDEEEKDA